MSLGISPSDLTLALAPMQDVTDLPFWKLIASYGGPDLYFTEYFRVHPTSTLERWILPSITENPTGKPAIAQMIGNDIPALPRNSCTLSAGRKPSANFLEFASGFWTMQSPCRSNRFIHPNGKGRKAPEHPHRYRQKGGLNAIQACGGDSVHGWAAVRS